MQSVAAATTAKLFEFQSIRRILFVFGRHIIAFFAFGALQNYVISRHNFLPFYLVSGFWFSVLVKTSNRKPKL